MNHLAHLALAGESPHLVVGGFLGDFVKGRLDNRFEPGIEAGIRLHRAIDAFTDHNPKVRLAASRFEVHLRGFCFLFFPSLLLFAFKLAKVGGEIVIFRRGELESVMFDATMR